MVKEQLAAMMERQRDDTSTGTSQVHSHYAEDDDHQPLPWPSHPQYVSFITMQYFYIGKWYFDTGFSLTSIWHSDVAVSSRLAKKEKQRWFSAYVVHVCLFAKGVFCHSFMFNNRFFVCYLWLLVWMCCVFYVEESYIGVLFGYWFASMPRCRSRLCALFMFGGYACMRKMVCCCVLGFWFPCFHPLPTTITSL